MFVSSRLLNLAQAIVSCILDLVNTRVGAYKFVSYDSFISGRGMRNVYHLVEGWTRIGSYVVLEICSVAK